MRTLHTKKCKFCNKVFKTFDESLEFCNISCRFKFEAENEKELDFGKEIEKELRLENSLEKKLLCILCGWEFTPKNNSQLCCSKECSHTLQKQRARKNAIIRYYRKKNEEIEYD